MANHLDLEEQEQLDQLKHFWNTWGTLISAIALVVFGSLAAWNGYQYWQKRQAVQAAALFDAVDASVAAKDSARIQQALGDLQSGYGRTAQAGLASLQAARALVTEGKLDEAKAALQWTADNASDKGHQALARLRLSAVLVQQQAYDDALKQLSASVPPEFDALVADRQGDIYALQNKKAEAIAAYEKAYKRLEEGLDYRRLVEAKLNALGVQPSVVAAAPAQGAAQ